MNKKTVFILFAFTFFIFAVVCYATEPYSDRIITTSNKNKTIKLEPDWGDALVTIENSRGEIIKGFTIDDIGLTYKDYHFTSAGNDWYQNSISFINKTEEYFIVRLRSSKIIIIDLKNNNLLQDIPDSLNNEINKTVYQKATNLLDSQEPEDRRTGAIVCGQMKIEEAIPRLKKLLEDRSFYTHTGYLQTGEAEDETIVLFVRRAAKEALETLGQEVENVIVELKAEGHLRIDAKTGYYVVVFDDEK